MVERINEDSPSGLHEQARGVLGLGIPEEYLIFLNGTYE
jgi:hypothetical protein